VSETPAGGVGAGSWTVAELTAARTGEDISALGDAELLDRAREAQRVLDWLDLTMLGLVAELDSRGPRAWRGSPSVEAYLQRVLGLSPAEADAVVRVARAADRPPAPVASRR
jgi:hypothetical protein